MNLRGRASNKASPLSLIFILCLGAIFATYVYYSTWGSSVSCNSQLEDQVGTRAHCFKPVGQVSLVATNTSEFNVPVMVIKPGSTAMITILYHEIAKDAPANVYPPFTSNSRPYALSVASGRLMLTGVVFSTGDLLYKNGSWYLYQYTLTTSVNSSGYYAFLPPFYYGFYPAIYVGNSFPNKTSLSMWGFAGIIESGEFILPSTIVGMKGNIQVLNETVPEIAHCPNPACLIISHSGF